MTDSKQLEQNQIQVQVCNPESKGGIQKHIEYQIIGKDKNGSFQFSQRFSNFYVFRESLVKRWPGLFIPPIPEKQSIGNLNQEFVQQRCMQLDRFLKDLSQKPYLWYSQETEIFFTKINDLEKEYNKLLKLNVKDIISRYQEAFQELVNSDADSLDNYIFEFNNFINKSQVVLKSYKNLCKNFKDSFYKQIEQQHTMLTFLLPEYEKNCLTEYSQSLDENSYIFDQKNEEIKKKIVEYLEISKITKFDKLNDEISFELGQLDALQECIKERDLIQKQIQKLDLKINDTKQLKEKYNINGKTGIGGLFNKKPKEQLVEETEAKIEGLTEELEQNVQLYNLLTQIQGSILIENFKENKVAIYKKIVKEISQQEVQQAKTQNEFWTYIQQNPHVDQQEIQID